MKTSFTIAIFFFLLAFTISTNALSTTVLDISGKRLKSGVPYHILPVLGGGVKPSLSPRQNTTCPLDVVQTQSRSRSSKSVPVTFSPANHGKFISLSTDLNVEFQAPGQYGRKKCSSVWKLAGDDDESSSRRFVKTGGVAGAPGPETLSNWFKIARNEDDDKRSNDYKIVFCPTVCNFCKVICRDVAVFERVAGYGVNKLGLSLNESLPPFLVRFKRA